MTCCVDVYLDPMIIDNRHQGVVLDEVRQEAVRIWANLVYLCPHTEEEVVFGTLRRAAVTHLKRKRIEILNI